MEFEGGTAYITAGPPDRQPTQTNTVHATACCTITNASVLLYTRLHNLTALMLSSKHQYQYDNCKKRGLQVTA